MGQSQDTEVVRRHSSLLRSRNCQVVTCLVSKGPFLWHSLGQRRELACVSSVSVVVSSRTPQIQFHASKNGCSELFSDDFDRV